MGFIAAGIEMANQWGMQVQAQKFIKDQRATRYQTSVKDLEKAGLNPLLAVGPGMAAPVVGAGQGSANIAGGMQTDDTKSVKDIAGYSDIMRKLKGEADTAENQAGMYAAQAGAADASARQSNANAAATESGQVFRDMNREFDASPRGRLSHELGRWLPHGRDAGVAIGGAYLGITGAGRLGGALKKGAQKVMKGKPPIGRHIPKPALGTTKGKSSRVRPGDKVSVRGKYPITNPNAPMNPADYFPRGHVFKRGKPMWKAYQRYQKYLKELRKK